VSSGDCGNGNLSVTVPIVRSYEASSIINAKPDAVWEVLTDGLKHRVENGG